MEAEPGLARWYGRTVPAWALGVCRIGVGAGSALMALEGEARLECVFARPCVRAPVLGRVELSLEAIRAWGALWIALAVLLALGVRARLVAALLALTMGAVLLLDEQLYSNHLLLAAILAGLLSLSECGAALSWSARGEPRGRRVGAWPADLIRAQVTIVYVFAAVSKINDEFLSGQVLSVFLVAPLRQALPAAALPWLSFGAVVAELTLPALLWSRRGRRAGALLGGLLHASFVLGMGGNDALAWLAFGAFALVAVGTYPLFLCESEPAAEVVSTGGEGEADAGG